MNNSREEVPRVSLDSVEDWKRIKSTYTDFILAQLEDDNIPADSPVIKYMQRVGVSQHYSHIVTKLLAVYREVFDFSTIKSAHKWSKF